MVKWASRPNGSEMKSAWSQAEETDLTDLRRSQWKSKKTTSSDVSWNKKSSTAHPIQPPAIPPRPGRPALFLQPSTALQINVERVLGAHQRLTEIQNLEISQQEQILAGTDNLVHNPFTHAHDTLVFNSANHNTQYATINPNSQPSLPPYSLHTAPITLDSSEANENNLLNPLPPITNMSISSDTNTAKSEYLLEISIKSALLSIYSQTRDWK